MLVTFKFLNSYFTFRPLAKGLDMLLVGETVFYIGWLCLSAYALIAVFGS